MAGKAGRSGRKPQSAAWHLVRGTYRPDRHGPRPVAAVAGTAALQPVTVSPVPKAIAADLNERGLRLVRNLWAMYEDWTPGHEAVLHEVGVVADRLADYARHIAQAGIVVTTPNGQAVPHPLLRLQAQAQRTFVLLLAALNLKEN